MRDRLQKAFAEVRSEDELKAKTLEAVCSRARRRKKHPLIWAAACLMIVLCVGGGLFFTPVSAIGIEINPAIKLRINRFDIVIGVEGLNKDGKRLAKSTGLMFTEYSKAIDALLNSSQMQAYLEQGKEMSICVLCDDEQRSTKMLARVESCVGEGGNITCHAGTSGHSHESVHGKDHSHRHGHCGGEGDEKTE